MVTTTLNAIDKAFFQHLTRKLEGATPETICEYYVTNLIFHNEGYLQYLTKAYHLPNDMLKMHAKIVKLGQMGMI